jgi:hypothetical protein
MKKFLTILFLALALGCGNDDSIPNHRPSREEADQFLMQTGFVKVGFLGTTNDGENNDMWFDYSATSPSTPNILYRVSIVHYHYRNKWTLWNTNIIGNGNLVFEQK